MMIDAHIIPTKGWELQVEEQLCRIKHPLITPHVGTYVPGDILRARADGIKMGNNPYVTWIDPDDEVLDVRWVEQAVDALETNPKIAAVYCRWVSSQNGAITYTSPAIGWHSSMNCSTVPAAHTFTIARRKNITRVLDYALSFNEPITSTIDSTILGAQQYFGTMLLNPTMAYHWKTHSKGGRLLTNTPTALRILSNIRNGVFMNNYHK